MWNIYTHTHSACAEQEDISNEDISAAASQQYYNKIIQCKTRDGISPVYGMKLQSFTTRKIGTGYFVICDLCVCTHVNQRFVIIVRFILLFCVWVCVCTSENKYNLEYFALECLYLTFKLTSLRNLRYVSSSIIESRSSFKSKLEKWLSNFVFF